MSWISIPPRVSRRDDEQWEQPPAPEFYVGVMGEDDGVYVAEPSTHLKTSDVYEWVHEFVQDETNDGFQLVIGYGYGSKR